MCTSCFRVGRCNSKPAKSYLATALGDKVYQEDFKVMYTSCAKLVSQLKIAKTKGTVLSDLKRIERSNLLILDDFGMQAFDSQGRGIMMDIIEDLHQKRSTMITSQFPVKSWHNIIGEPTNKAGAVPSEA